uniref:Protein ARV n=1 Tax=Timema bartmani TaxID=61472 RepID=A0A7R9I235_9NEOP|nr:unnamed protein product [Timema bartmani]
MMNNSIVVRERAEDANFHECLGNASVLYPSSCEANFLGKESLKEAGSVKIQPPLSSLGLKESCQQIADKYLEYDPVNIIIDLVLLNEQAYRHILYNYNFQLDTHSQLDLFDLLHLMLVTGSTMLFLIVCATTKVLRPPHDCHYVTLWKALVLASFCKFLLVPGLIWGEMGPVTHHYFVTGYTLMSQLKAHSGTAPPTSSGFGSGYGDSFSMSDVRANRIARAGGEGCLYATALTTLMMNC